MNIVATANNHTRGSSMQPTSPFLASCETSGSLGSGVVVVGSLVTVRLLFRQMQFFPVTRFIANFRKGMWQSPYARREPTGHLHLAERRHADFLCTAPSTT